MLESDKITLFRESKRIDIGFGFLNGVLEDLIMYSEMLHPNEMNYYNTLEFDKRKISYLLGRLASKKAILALSNQAVLANEFSIEFGVFRFPIVNDYIGNSIQVSISHCDNIGVALAFPQEHPMSLDIEKIDSKKTNFMKYVICENELRILKRNLLKQDVGYTLIWSVKEALSKVLKTGLTTDFRIFEIESILKKEKEQISFFRFFSQYKAVSRKIGDYMYSIVLPKNTEHNFDKVWDMLIKFTNTRKYYINEY